MHKVGGKLILWLLIIALVLFTAIRTLHFLQMTLPSELGYVAYLGLAAFDIGILGWLYYASHSAEGDSQRALAYGMIFVCMGGVIITTIADMIIVSSQNGLTKLPPQWSTIGLWGVIIVIVMNVVAGILVHLQRLAKRLTPLLMSFEQPLAQQEDSHSAGTSQQHQKQKRL